MQLPRLTSTTMLWAVLLVTLLALAAIGAPRHARAQARVAAHPLIGGQSERLTLSGVFDAQANMQNPGGLALVRETSAVLAYQWMGDDHPSASGSALGLHVAWAPRRLIAGSSVGASIEALWPHAGLVRPSVGSPVRLTTSWAVPLGISAGIGVAWQHYFDKGPLDGVDSLSLGLAFRLGRHVGVGAVARDLNAPRVQGTEVERRYELEATVRPWHDGRLELRGGGRFGEVRHMLDAWGGVAVRVARGVELGATVATNATIWIDDDGGQREQRDIQGWLGVTGNLGKSAVALWGSAGRRAGDAAVYGGGGSISIFATPRPHRIGHAALIERVILRGAMSDRALLAAQLRLARLAEQPEVRAVALVVDDLGGGWGSLRELRDAVEALGAAGKPVYAYLVGASMREYYVASAAAKVYLDPAGGLRLTGMASVNIFMRDFIEMLGGEAEFEKVAEYKSAPEMFTEMGPTDPAKRMREELVADAFEIIVADVARARHLSPESARTALTGGPYTPASEAVAALIDGVATPDELSDIIAGAYPGVRAGVTLQPIAEDWRVPAIGVVYLDADIVDGASQTVPLIGRRTVGSKTIVAALGELRADREVKAVVVRIDSPGGSALASELISREIAKLAAVKPVVCSLGDVAASGGYFAAAACTKVIASPTTITGSIGIFAGKFNIASALSRWGMAVDVTKIGERADIDALYRPRTEEERAMVRDNIRYYYGRFVATVAKGRGLTEAQVEEVARGRVMSGRRALAVGLVDQLGSFRAAIDQAAALAGLADGRATRLVELPHSTGGLLGIVARLLLNGNAAERPANEAMLGATSLPSGWRAALEVLPASVLVAPQALQARLPYGLAW